MKILVRPHKVEILKDKEVNEREINVSVCEFEFSEEITEEFVKEAYFTLEENTYKQIIENDKCAFPNEALEHKGDVEIGVVAFLVENDQEIKRYNPSPAYFNTWQGSLKDAENSEPITPTDKEQIEQQLLNISTQMDNIDVEASKEQHTTTITITKKDGTSYDVEVFDGQKGDKGDKGDAGAIKMQITNALPITGSDDTIYLVPIEDPETGNNYDEYIYTNGQWEKLGGVQVEVDLTNYVQFTDYATSSKGGVVKVSTTYGTQITSSGNIQANTKNYTDYQSSNNALIIGKGTLENVITGKCLVSNTSYATDSVGGVVKVSDTKEIGVNSNGVLIAKTVDYADYETEHSTAFVSIGTLNNVITGKGLVSNTDYANTTTGGVIKTGGGYGSRMDSSGNISASSYDYTTYSGLNNYAFISKGTLENVLTARIGDIQTLLDNLNNGGGVE